MREYPYSTYSFLSYTSGWCALLFVAILFVLPETKGMSLFYFLLSSHDQLAYAPRLDARGAGPGVLGTNGRAR